MKEKETVTNAMRILRSVGIRFSTASYTVDEDDLSAVHAAAELGVDPGRIFKTLVTKGIRTGYNVFVIPAAEELDLKKCAVICGDKRLELIPVKELLPLTGYLRGGCSPIGMKKSFPTFVDSSAAGYDEIFVSAGLRGHQVILHGDDLLRITKGRYADLTVPKEEKQ